VDYIEISGNTTTGSWKPAAISGATVTQKTIGDATTSMVSGNTRGVWIKGVTSGANFTGQITLQLSDVPTKFNACAYATDYPPNVSGTTSFTFKGTPPFIIKYSDGSTYSVTSKTGYTPVAGKTFTEVVSDKTEYPGGCIAPGGISTFADFVPCPGVANASTWTLTDTRDSKQYRVVKMPDGKIWMGQNLNYHDVTYSCYDNVVENCNNEYGALYCYSVATVNGFCPSGWHLPTDTEWGTMLDAVEGSGNAHVNCPQNNTNCGQNAGKWLKAKTDYINNGSGSGSIYNDIFRILPNGWWTPNSSPKYISKGMFGVFLSVGVNQSTACARSAVYNMNGTLCGHFGTKGAVEYCGSVRCVQN
jgi:uncharacterized protein (TIGR02145 family)